MNTKDIETRRATPNGTGVHYLWHLGQVGCISKGDPTSAWKEALAEQSLPEQSPVRIAIIDNGCSLNHPNLPSRTDERCIVMPIEFSAHVEGTIYADDPDGTKVRFSNLVGALSDLAIDGEKDLNAFLGDAISNDLRQTICRYFNHDQGPVRVDLPSPSERFAAHGTCCAGLVAGRPETKDNKPESQDLNPSTIPYFGANPYSQIIPIATGYTHAYWPLIMGLLYAIAERADVILLPRAVEEMQDPALYAAHMGSGDGNESDPRKNGNLLDESRWAEKQLFEKLLAAISETVPVVVAAGNSGMTELEYPAKLSLANAPNLIVVGAATAYALRATYSSGFDPAENGRRAHHVTVYGPGDDREETSSQHFRRFDLAWRTRRIDLAAFQGSEDLREQYSPYGVVTTDIPGQYGYEAESPADLDLYEDRLDTGEIGDLTTSETLPRALYTLFGGTSAAASVIAGVVSLILPLMRPERRSGAAVHELLSSLAGESPIKPVLEEKLKKGKVDDSGNTLPGVDLGSLLRKIV